MINIKNYFIAAIYIILIVPAFGSKCLCEDAIRGAKTAGGLDSVVGALNNIFVFENQFDKTNKNDKGSLKQSILDNKADLYVENFYKWYGKDAFKEIIASEDIDKDSNTIKSTGTLFDKYGQTVLQKDSNQVDIEVNKELEGYIERTLKKTPKEQSDGVKDLFNKALVYMQSKKGASDPYPDMLNPMLLFSRMITKQDNEDNGANSGADKYSKQAQNFMKSLGIALFPIKTFYFPPETEKDDGRAIEIQVPLIDNTDAKKPLPYTTVKITAGRAKYKEVKEKVSNNPLYQEYVLKNLADLSMRSSLINNIFYALKAREKKDGRESLFEKESRMATEGLSPNYYKLNSKGVSELTMAEVNLKNLHTNNKMVYFLYQIAKQMERANFMQTIKALQEQEITSTADDQKYIQPIMNAIIQEINGTK